MATLFGTFNKNANVFDKADLSTYIKDESIEILQNNANQNSIAGKLSALEVHRSNAIERLNELEERDYVTFLNLSSSLSAEIDQDLIDNAAPYSILGRLSALETTLGIIDVEIQNILDGNFDNNSETLVEPTFIKVMGTGHEDDPEWDNVIATNGKASIIGTNLTDDLEVVVMTGDYQESFSIEDVTDTMIKGTILGGTDIGEVEFTLKKPNGAVVGTATVQVVEE